MPRTKNFDIAALARSINVAGNGDISFGSSVSAGTGGETIGSLTASMDSNQTSTITLTSTATPVPIVQAYKEVSQPGLSSKGSWDVNANATNYDFYDEKPISYSSVSLTPSATGDGTFTLSSSAGYNGYSLSAPSFGSSFNVGSQAGNPQEVVMKTDGTKMYVLDVTTKTIFEYDLSTNFDSSTATYNSVNSGSLGTTIAGDPYGLRFKPDGTKLYICEYGGILYQFSLGTAWDLSTISYDNQSITGFAGGYVPYCLAFKPDGTKVYTVGLRYLYEWVLPTAWSLSGATPTNIANGASANYLNIGAATGNSFYGLDFSADGTKFFVRFSGGTNVGTGLFEIPIDSAWDPVNSTQNPIATDGQHTAGVIKYDALDTAHGSNNLTGFAFVNNGQQAVVCYSGAQDYVYTLNTIEALSFSSADVGKKVVGNSGSAVITSTAGAYTSVTSFADTSAISSWQLYGAEGKSDGTGIQLTGIAVNDVYSLSTASYDNKSFNASSQVPGAQGIAIKDDGTAMYLIGYTNDTVYQYTLSTAWDVSTASYSNKSFSVATQDAVPRDIRFKSDGTSFYVIASTADSIFQYDLSTAWDISTASYSNKSFSVQTQMDNPSGLAVSADGTKFYVCHYGDTSSYQYDLTTAWDISTASYNNKVFTSTSGGAQQESIYISSDGLKFFVSGTIDDAVYQYDLSTAWDISTASTTHSASLSPADVGLDGVLTNGWYNFTFNATGQKFYSFGNSNDIVYQLSTGAGVSYTHPYSQYSPALTNSSSGQINSSTWIDINSMTADETKNGGDIFYAVSTDNRTTWAVIDNTNGVRNIVKNNSGTWQYNNSASFISEIWVNGTNNNEHATLQQALGAQSFNRMNKAQLDAVTDANHYTLGNTLDLMIAPYAASGASPISDGVTINYDAESFYRQATPGVDYTADFIGTNRVDITSNISANLKIKVV